MTSCGQLTFQVFLLPSGDQTCFPDKLILITLALLYLEKWFVQYLVSDLHRTKMRIFQKYFTF